MTVEVESDDAIAPTWGTRFDIALRGYDRVQVDRHVAELAQRVIVLRNAVASAEAAARVAHAEAAQLAQELADLRSRLAVAEKRAGVPIDGAERLMALAALTAEKLRAEAAELRATATAAAQAAQDQHAKALETAAAEKAAILAEARRIAVTLAEAGRATAEARRAEGVSSRKRAEQAARRDADQIIAEAHATADRIAAEAAADRAVAAADRAVAAAERASAEQLCSGAEEAEQLCSGAEEYVANRANAAGPAALWAEDGDLTELPARSAAMSAEFEATERALRAVESERQRMVNSRLEVYRHLSDVQLALTALAEAAESSPAAGPQGQSTGLHERGTSTNE